MFHRTQQVIEAEKKVEEAIAVLQPAPQIAMERLKDYVEIYVQAVIDDFNDRINKRGMYDPDY